MIRLKCVLILGICVLTCHTAKSDDQISEERAKELKQYIEYRRVLGLTKVGRMKASSRRKGILRKPFRSKNYVPKMSLLKPKKIGYVNLYDSIPFGRIFQVTGKNEFVMSLHSYQSKFYSIGFLIKQTDAREVKVGYIWVKGVSTKGLVDNKASIGFRGVFVYDGTKKYESITVHVIRHVSKNDLKRIQSMKVPSIGQQKRATRKLISARRILKTNEVRGKKMLQDIVKNYPETFAANTAQKLLENM